MAKVEVRYTDYFAQTIQRMREDGLLLVTMGTGGRANVMTIGWGMMGSIWSRPLFIVLVRPSRHTYSQLEQVGDFTVDVADGGQDPRPAEAGGVAVAQLDRLTGAGGGAGRYSGDSGGPVGEGERCLQGRASAGVQDLQGGNAGDFEAHVSQPFLGCHRR